MDDITAALTTLEALSSSPSTSASGPLNALLERQFGVARERIAAGSDPQQVIKELLSSVARSKKEVEKGLKGWYSALGGVGKAVEKVSTAAPVLQDAGQAETERNRRRCGASA